MLGANVIIGPLLDRYGPRPLTITFAFLFVFSCMMISLCSEYYQYFLAQGVLLGIGLALGFATPMTCTVLWWKARAPFAVAIVVSGSSLGGIIWPLIVKALLANPKIGLGWTWRILGFIGLALLIVSAATITSPLPTAAQRYRAAVKSAQLEGKDAPPKPPVPSFFYPQLFLHLPYAFNSIAFMCTYLGFLFVFFYTPSMLASYGATTDLQFYSLSIINAASFFGRLLLPLPSLWYGQFNVLCICLLSSGIIVLSQLAVTSVAGVLITGAFYGFWSGGAISLQSPCTAVLIEDKTRLGTGIGQLAAVSAIPAMLGPPIAGWLLQTQAGYQAPRGFSGAMLLTGFGLFVVVKFMRDRNFLAKV